MPLAFLLQNGLNLSIALAAVGLVVALILIRQILAASPGNAKMQEIGGAVQAGAEKPP